MGVPHALQIHIPIDNIFGNEACAVRSVEHKARLLRSGTLALFILLTQVASPASIDDDRKTIPEPKERQVSPVPDYVTSAIIKPAAKRLNVPGDVLNIIRSSKEAENVTELD